MAKKQTKIPHVMSDEELCAAMATPFESVKMANEACLAFFDEVYELRKKYRIANVSVIVADSINNNGCFMNRFQIGDSFKTEAMAAWNLGQAAAERQQQMISMQQDVMTQGKPKK